MAHHHAAPSAGEALKRLKDGNARFLQADFNGGNVSPKVRLKTAREGQSPYAVVVCCSDSRVIPESIFQAGIGELFVIRVAGNVLDKHQLGSVEYALAHLGCNLVVMLGHDNCGAVTAAVTAPCDGFVKSIADEILLAAGEERDVDKACRLNVLRGVRVLEEELRLKGTAVQAVGAVYHLETGSVEFL